MPSERVQRQIDRLLDEAEQAIGARDWALVEARCDAALALDARNADALSYLAAARQRLAGQPAAVAPPAPAPLPASFVNGRYTVLELLGEGGTKVVYHVQDTVLEREVAFALLKTDGLDAEGRERVRREAQLLAQLGADPHIVTVFDLGEDANRPYLVSELLPGGDLDALVRAAPDHRLPLEQVLAIGKALAEALAFAHDRGVIHRDLKPGNVWFTLDGVAKLGDFGLAVTSERSRLTQVGMVVGTVAYMPPEQALGGQVTPQADLYSLGCVLYELVTGRPPFLADDPTAIITQHLNTAPVAPSWLTDRCPPELERLILHLLAKRPEQRTDSAAEVVQALARIDPAQRSPSHSRPAANPLERLARGVFVGRESELSRLRQACDQAFAGQGGLVMLVGEPGIGKTRTTRELETYARLRGAQVLWGQSHEDSGAPSYWPWIQIGRQWGAGTEPARLVAQLGSAVAELGRLFPELEQLPGVPPPPVREPEAAQFALFDAFVQFLRVASAQSPLLLVLDDLHWADRPTLQLLQHLAGELARLRVLVAATYRDTELARTHPLSQTLAVLNRSAGFTRIVLRGLSRNEVASYVETAAGTNASPVLLERLYDETEGNPFFLSEVVNLLTEEGTLTSAKISEIRVPDGVKEALGRRLDRLSAETTALLQVAAIIGREFTYDTLTLLGDESDDSLLRHIEAGVAARVIEELPQAGRYRFSHALMQETLLGELSTTRKVRLHGQVGEALEQRYGAQAEARAARLVLHFGEAATLSGRHAAKAIRYGKLAAEQAEAATAWAEAARHYELVLGLLAGSETGIQEDQAALYAALARCYARTYESRAAWRNAMRAIGLYQGRGDAVGLGRVTLEALASQPPPARGLALVDVALAVLGEQEPGLEAALLATRATLDGHDETSQRSADRAEELARAYGYGEVLGILTMRTGGLAIAAGRYEEAVSGYLAAQEHFAAAGRAVQASAMLGFAALAVEYAGRLTEAEAAAQRALVSVRTVHVRRAEQAVLEHLAGIALARRDEARFDALLPAIDPTAMGGRMLRSLREELAANLPAAVELLPAPELAGGVPSVLLASHGQRARVRLHAGDVEGARQELAAWCKAFAVCASEARNSRTATTLPLFFAVVDRALVELGDEDTVGSAYALLQRWPALRFCHLLAQGVDHLRGDLALRLGLVDEAETHFRTGLAWGEHEGVPVEQGRCLQGLAETALRRGDAVATHQQLEQAATIFEQARAPLYLQQVVARALELRERVAERSSIPLSPYSPPRGESNPLLPRSDFGGDGSPPLAGPTRADLPAAPAAAAAGGAITRPRTIDDQATSAPTSDRPSPAGKGQGLGQVFISYASDDRPRAAELAALLEAESHTVWLDKRSIAGGAGWDEEIVRGIRGCRVLAVLCSPAAMASPNVQQELRLALQYRKPILPLRLAEAAFPEGIEYILAGRQWVEVLDLPQEEWLPRVLHALERLT